MSYSDVAIVEQQPQNQQQEDEDSDDMDCAMPELGCDFSVADLGCEADVDDEVADDKHLCQQQQQQPRRLSLQQRRRLNLYSKPSVLPTLNLPVLTQGGQQQSGTDIGVVGWMDTPTIREEDSGIGSVTSPEQPPKWDASGSAGSAKKRTRTVSLDSPGATAKAVATDKVEAAADNNGNDNEEAGSAADCSPEGDDAGKLASPGRRVGFASRLRTVSACHASNGGSSGGGGTSRWPRALNLVFQNLKNDAWRDMPLARLPEETAIRHRYNAHKRQWIQDTVRVKIEPQPFNRGAMRECFRLKKPSGFSKFESWHSRACNYVAKKYIETVDPSVYFEDVRLQMNAKLWAQEYNRHHPPKKVDIMQMCVIEFKEREGAPLYHLEHHIEGDYVKHNSNSGFVDENARRTPHALSHFTFERSGHQLIVVDIQGVDDIYTDPQIHTAEGKEYGDGNLGVRGMALFFSSHVCNEICHRLGLSHFDMAPSEVTEQPSPIQSNRATRIRGEVFAIGSPMSPPSRLDSGCSTEDDDYASSGGASSSGGGGQFRRRRRTTSGDEMTPEEELAALSAALKRRERPSCVPGHVLRCSGCDAQLSLSAIRSRSDENDDSASASGSGSLSRMHSHQPLPGMPEVRCQGPILGRIHHELARLHDAGRLVGLPIGGGEHNAEEAGHHQAGQLEDLVDWPAALFHERLAGQLGVVEAALNLARLHLGLPADCLAAAPAEALRPDAAEGHRWMEAAARLGDRSAMLYLARAHDRGDTPGLKKDWDRAAHFYQRALATSGQTDREGGYDSLDTPSYLLRARLAELYMYGGSGLEADPASSAEIYGEAAEEAMSEGNGKLASKYYCLAEEAAALVPEEGEEAAEE